MKYTEYWILQLVPNSHRSTMIAILTTLLVVDMYNCKILWGSGATMVGRVVNHFLISSKASYASLDHWNLSYFLRRLKKASPLMLRHELNLLRAAIHPVNFCMSWRLSGGAMFVIADNFSGLGSVPHRETIYPSNLCEGTLNVHFSGVQVHFKFPKVDKGLC
jgi:hypothetical protein